MEQLGDSVNERMTVLGSFDVKLCSLEVCRHFLSLLPVSDTFLQELVGRSEPSSNDHVCFCSSGPDVGEATDENKLSSLLESESPKGCFLTDPTFAPVCDGPRGFNTVFMFP
jgi:hypothetical protein